MQIAVLSPHRDDAAFSCGLAIRALLATKSEVSIINLCTVSIYAPYLPTDNGERIQQVMTAREKEDLLFAEKVTVDAKANPKCLSFIDLGWKDGPLRWSVPDEQMLELIPIRSEEVDALAQSLRRFSGSDLVFAPLAFGGHLDHRLMNEAASITIPQDSLLFYEDLPYACSSFTVRKCQSSLNHADAGDAWMSTALNFPGAKMKYAACYASQIAMELAKGMEAHAEQLGGSERFFGTPSAIRKLQTAIRVQGSSA